MQGADLFGAATVLVRTGDSPARSPQGHAGPTQKRVPCRSGGNEPHMGVAVPRCCRSRMHRTSRDASKERTHAADQPAAYGKVEACPRSRRDLTFRGPDPPDDRRGSPEAPRPARAHRHLLGFDPSADSLHVGNLMQLCTLRRFQDAGHRTISLAGGGTGMIGDPGGKQDERQLLSLETIEGYLQKIRPQLAQFLDLTDGRGLLLNNADWLGTLDPRVRRGQALHGQPDGGEGVRQEPLQASRSISYTEFSYMLLQTVCGSTSTTAAMSSSVATSGATSRAASTTCARSAATRCGASPRRSSSRRTAPSTASPSRATSASIRSGRARSPCSVLPQHARRTVVELIKFLTFLEHDRITELERFTAEEPQQQAQRALARAVALDSMHGRPGGQVRGEPRPPSSARRSPRSARRCCWP